MIGHPGALIIPSPFHSNGYPGFGKPRWIIIHGTASGIAYPAQSTGHDFQRQGNSTHYVVGYDGTIVQCVDEANAAWGNGVITGPAGVAPIGGGNPKADHDAFWDTAGKHDPNSCTISIEHSKSSDNQSALSAIQKQRSFELVRGICSRWGIPLKYADTSGGVTGHYSIDPVYRSFCPGPYPFSELFGGAPISTPFPTGVPTSTPFVPQPTPTFTPLLAQVHETLINTPGFYGLALAIDEAEKLPGWVDLTVKQPDISILGQDTGIALPDVVGEVRSIGATIGDNFLPVAIRSGTTIIGTVLLVALLTKLIEKPVKEILPLAMEAATL